MKTRSDLQLYLENVSGVKVYFNPPETVQLTYPCIVYNRDYIYNHHADNKIHLQENRYVVNVLDKKVDGDIFKIISKLPRCRYKNHSFKNGISQDSFTLYF